MIPNDALINALRKLNFHYKSETDRVLLYKKAGSTNRVAVRRLSLHDDNAAKKILRDAGMSEEEIERFITAYRCTEH